MDGTAVAELVLEGVDTVGVPVQITAEWQGPTGELLTETNSVCGSVIWDFTGPTNIVTCDFIGQTIL